MTIYMPYVSSGSPAALDGRVIIPEQQHYYANPFDHLMYNSTFLAETKSEVATFDYHAGLVKIELQYDLQNIQEVSVMVGNVTLDGDFDDNCVGEVAIDNYAEEFIVNGKNHVVVTGFPEGTNTTVSNPLTVWAAMAPGVYENLVVEIVSADMTISSPVKGPFVVEKKGIAENVCVAKEVKYDNGVDDFVGEEGQFNPKN
jgi:hypothetical protein